ncbi:DUF2470-containing protein [Aureococcus anophagefferens]|nr:DUF2470-containing protein [Aureococcus anophagefferens]
MARLLLALMLGAGAAFQLPHRPARTVLRSAATDVTGTKFEEEDEKKNPQRRPGHQVKGMRGRPGDGGAPAGHPRAPGGCPRLTWAEEIRSIAAQRRVRVHVGAQAGSGPTGGFPSGSMVGFAIEEESGRPIFCFASMSGHTKNLGVLRVPFPEPVTERKKIKDAIVGLSKQCAAIAAAAEEEKAEA